MIVTEFRVKKFSASILCQFQGRENNPSVAQGMGKNDPS